MNDVKYALVGLTTLSMEGKDGKEWVDNTYDMNNKDWQLGWKLVWVIWRLAVVNPPGRGLSRSVARGGGH